MNERTTEASEEIEALKEDLRVLRQDLRGLLSAARRRSGNHVDDVRNRLSEFGRHGVEEIRRRLLAARERTRDAADKTEKTIREHPFTTVLAALGVGLIVGRFLRR